MKRAVGMLSSNTWRDIPAILGGLLLNVSSKADLRAVERYEAAFSQYLGGGASISFGAARMGLSAILEAWGIGPGDEVILPGYTCVVVSNAILFQGAKPVYVDIDDRTYGLNPQLVEQAITEKTKVIFAQHSFGIPCDLDAIMGIAGRHGLKVMEDCAPALGATYKGRPVGTYGDAAIFSSERTKVISTGMGGMAYTRDANLATKLREIQQRCPEPERAQVRLNLSFLLHLILFQGPLGFHYSLPEYYLRRLKLIGLDEMTESESRCLEPNQYMQRLSGGLARVGLSQLKRLDANLEKRRSFARFYSEKLPKLGLRACEIPEHIDPVFVRYPVDVDDKYGLFEALKSDHVFLGMWFTAPVHPASVDQELAQYEAGSCPVAEQVCDRVINLPTHPRLKRKDAHRLLDLLKDAIKVQVS